MEKQTGIWIDYKRAMIVDPNDGKKISTIYSDVNNAGSRQDNKTKYGGQSMNPEKKLEAKRKKALKDYFGDIIDQLDDQSELYIFGPAEAKLELKKEIEYTAKHFQKMTVKTSDSMTDNQIVANVKSFFNQN